MLIHRLSFPERVFMLSAEPGCSADACCCLERQPDMTVQVVRQVPSTLAAPRSASLVASQQQMSDKPSCSEGGSQPAPDKCTLPPDTQLGLIDMPAPWLHDLLEAVAHSPGTPDQPALVALSRTCRFLRDLVLSQHTVHLQVLLPTQPETATLSQGQVLLACLHSSHVKLKLILDSQQPVEQRTPEHINVSAVNLMSGTMAAAGGGLKAIKSVELQHLQLQSLVPHWLSSTCPHMTSLTLNACGVQSVQGMLPPLATPTPPCSQPTSPTPASSQPTSPCSSQLRQLSLAIQPPTTPCSQPNPPCSQPTTPCSPPCSQLRELHLTMPPPTHASCDRWQQWLRALPGLTSLSLDPRAMRADLVAYHGHQDVRDTAGDGEQVARAVVDMMMVCSVLGTQLTRLQVPCTHGFNQVVAGLVTWFPHLRELRLQDDIHPSGYLDDECLDMLLTLQHLTTLHLVPLHLEQSHRHRPCAWTHLTFGEINVASFDRLPLEGVRSLQVKHDYVRVDVCRDRSAVDRVAAVLARCGGVTWGCLQGRKEGNLTQWGPPGPGQGPPVLPSDGEEGRPEPIVCLCNPERPPGSVDSEGFAAILPIVASCRPVHFAMACIHPVTPDVLGAIRQHLGDIPVKTFEMDRCKLAVEAWALLLPSLPDTVCEVKVLSYCVDLIELREAQVTEMCVHACRPVKVTVMAVGLQEGWVQRVQAAMAAAGHQHVELRWLQ